VNASSLPYAVLILLVELGVGSLAIATIFDARRQVTAGYVKAAAITVLAIAVLAVAVGAGLRAEPELDGYALRTRWLAPLRLAVGGFAVIAAVYMVAAFVERHRAAVAVGGAGAGVGVAALVLLAAVVAAPAWSYVGTLASLLASAAVLGGALAAMMWGHWYLTSGRLPKEPMEQMSLVVLGALVLQGVLVLAGSVLPAREVPLSEGFGVGLVQNPAFWLRISVGLLFPTLLAWLAWRAARIRGMMSATGLLYIALGAVLAGEVLARGLLFSTGLAV